MSQRSRNVGRFFEQIADDIRENIISRVGDFFDGMELNIALISKLYREWNPDSPNQSDKYYETRTKIFDQLIDLGDDVVGDVVTSLPSSFLAKNIFFRVSDAGFSFVIEEPVDAVSQHYYTQFKPYGVRIVTDMRQDLASNLGIYVGSNRSDAIFAANRDCEIYGFGRGDKLVGNGGDDTVDGGSGNDLISGWGGADKLFGGEGRDTIYGNTQEDPDNVYGGNDSLWGGTDNDVLYGGSGDDLLNGQEGHDQLYGGKGNDRYVYYAQDTIVEKFGEGFDTLIISNRFTERDKLPDNVEKIEVGVEADARVIVKFDNSDFVNGEYYYIQGNVGDDKIVVNYSGDAGDRGRVNIYTGEGKDTVAVTGFGPNMFFWDFDRGEDTLDLRWYNIQGEVGETDAPGMYMRVNSSGNSSISLVQIYEDGSFEQVMLFSAGAFLGFDNVLI